MSILTYPLGFIGGGVEKFSYNGVMENSLRFNGTSAYLARTPSTASNRRTFTFSTWIKWTGTFTGDNTLFGTGNGNRDTMFLFQGGESNPWILDRNGANAYHEAEKTVDPSAWYHFTFVIDTTQQPQIDRCKIYVNGQLRSRNDSQQIPTQNYETAINQALAQHIGKNPYGASGHFDGYMSDVYFIDGYALGPENFGEYKKGVWIPKNYAGPPPLLTDSSSQTHSIRMAGHAGLNYDNKYIGNSSIKVDDDNTFVEVHPTGDEFNFGERPWTVDVWMNYTGGAFSNNLQILGARSAGYPGYASPGTSASKHVGIQYDNYGGNDGWMFVGHDGTTGLDSAESPADSGMPLNKWTHLSLVYNLDTLTFYKDGVHWIQKTSMAGKWANFGSLIWTLGSSTTTTTGPSYYHHPDAFIGYFDEFRLMKGEALPPRFYFGTNYGDQDGGRFPQRATSADRFADDERTLILISGQSANNHARSVSIVDESGSHTDNIHSSNSTGVEYPTQDGIGKQFTISGPQQTTKEAFIGNTSSILFDGVNDYCEVPTSTGFDFIQSQDIQWDCWLYINRDTIATDYIFERSSAGTASYYFAIIDNNTIRFQEWVGGVTTRDFDLHKDIPVYQWVHFTFHRTFNGYAHVYMDGVPASTARVDIGNTGISGGSPLRFGMGESNWAEYYIDEIRILQSPRGSASGNTGADTPQIKWTHTQTAGAGNKDAYDINGWKAYGHEFTDDNATSLLVHGDSYVPSYNFNNTTSATKLQTASEYTIDDGGGWTISIWYNANTAIDANPHNFIGESLDEDVDIGYCNLYARKLAVYKNESGTWHYQTTTPTLGVWNHGVYSYNGTGTLTFYHNGVADGTAAIGTENESLVYQYVGWSGHSSAYRYFHGELSQIGLYDGVLTSAEILTQYNNGLSTAFANGASATLGAHYDFGNAFTGVPDTSGIDGPTAIYDRSGNNRDVTRSSGTTWGFGGGMKDSSSANSIHHALVAGGGVHHSKAATMSMDGTNGTSKEGPGDGQSKQTRDDWAGNTAYWCGSNSSVTFANSSSFTGYGNTSIAIHGQGPTDRLYIPTLNGSITLGGTNVWSVSAWIYLDEGTDGTRDDALMIGFNETNYLFRFWGSHYDGTSRFFVGTGAAGGNYGGYGSTQGMMPNTWTQLTMAEPGGKAGRDALLYQDGIRLERTDSSGTNHTARDWTGGGSGGTDSFYIGNSNGTTGYNDKFHVTEVMVNQEHLPPRFYLGGGAAASDGELVSTKFMHFDGSNDCINLPNVGITGNSPFTIAAWVTMDDTTDRNMIFSWGGGSKARVDWELGRVVTNASYGLGIHFSGTTQAWGNALVGMENTWMFVAAMYDGTTIINTKFVKDDLYITDPVEIQGGTDGALNLVDINWVIGARNESESDGDGSGQFFDGRIAQVAVWDVELSQGALKDLWYKGPAGNWTVSGTNYTSVTTGDLKGYWAIGNHDAIASGTYTRSASGDNSTGGTADSTGGTGSIYDRSGNGKTGTIAGSRAIHTPATTVSMASKRLTYAIQHFDTAAATTLGTANLGNTHFANVAAQSVTASNFGGFVDDEYTVLLVRGGNADGNTHFTDGGVAAGETITFPAHSYSYGKSRIAKTVGTGGNPRHKNTNTLGIHGTSWQTDTDDDFLSISNQDFAHMNNNDFTIEWWFWTSDSGAAAMWDFRDSTDTTLFYVDHINTTTIQFVIGGSTSIVNPPTNVSDSTWHHVAIQRRYGIRWEIFYDGVESFKTGGGTLSDRWTKVTDPVASNSIPLRIGENYPSTAGYAGYMDEFRISTCLRYTPAGENITAIVPPMCSDAGSIGTSIPTIPYLRPTPFVAADGGRGFFANTNMRFWLKSDSYPGDTTLVDHSGAIGQTSKAITNPGHTAANRPTLQTGAGDFALSGGSDAMYFDGTDYITIPYHEDLELKGDPFTIECWIKTSDATPPAFSNIMSTGGEVGGSPSDISGWGLWLHSNGRIYFTAASTGNVIWGYSYAANYPVFTANLWSHIAIVMDRDVNQEDLMLQFIDGVCVYGKAGDFQKFTIGKGAASSGDLTIGREERDNDRYFTGWLDEIRISKMARYTAQGLEDSAYPNPSSEFAIQTEGTTYGKWDTQITANTTYQRYNYQHSIIKSYTFDGTNDEIYRSAIDVITGTSTTQMTIAGWFKPTTYGTYDVISEAQNDMFEIHQYATGQLWAVPYVTGASNPSGMRVNIPQTYEWCFYTMACDCRNTTDDGTDASGCIMYINGYIPESGTNITSAGASGTAGYFAQASDPVTLGALRGASNYFPGEIGQFGIWTTKLTSAQIAGIYNLGPSGNWKTSYSSNMRLYWAMGNQDTLTVSTADTSSIVYDRSGNGLNGVTTGSMSAPGSETKLLIHSNATIDGDTSITDSSPSAHLIDRMVSDPLYANSGVNRSSLAGPSYNGILSAPEVSGVGGTEGAGLIIPADSNLWTDSDVDTTIAFWFRTRTHGHTTLFSDGPASAWTGSSGVRGHTIELQSNDNLAWRIVYNGSASDTATNAFSHSNNTWFHLVMVRSGSTVTFYKNGSAMGTTGTDGDQIGYNNADVKIGMEMRDGPFGGTSQQADAYYDQVMIMPGVALSATNIGHLYGSGNANTTYGSLGGLILHEEYSDGTNTANAASTFLLHSNNATHHSQGSRLFYNDTANTRFTGTTGHEHAGYFTVGVSGTAFTVLGAHQTGYSPAMTQPSLRLRRGYSYVFVASSLGSHKFYFANSTANSTGYAYGSDASTNKHITGMYVSDTAPTVANKGSLTWTAMTSSHYLGSTDSDGYTYLKYEVPTDAPKDLYYRCGVPHGAMGNAVFVMEATEPAPIKVGTLPALKTSTWNDRDYAGIGTNKSVMALNGANYLQIPDHADWDYGTGDFSIQAWIYPNDISGAHNIYCHFQSTNTGEFRSFRLSTGNINWAGITTSSTKIIANKWQHIAVSRVSSTTKIFLDGVPIYSASDSTDYGALNGDLFIGMRNSGQYFVGFLDEIIVHKGSGYTVDTLIQQYQTGRAGNLYTANSSCVLYIKSDTTYGDTTFTDSSPSARTITNYGGVYHHIDDNRTANTALYFDGTSYLALGYGIPEIKNIDVNYCFEGWVKATNKGVEQGLFAMGDSGSDYQQLSIQADSGYHFNGGSPSCGTFGAAIYHQWHHVAVSQDQTGVYFFQNGICIKSSGGAILKDADREFMIGAYKSSGTVSAYFTGWMDGVRVTAGMPRYTSGIPVDGQTPHKQYDDGRSSNVSSNTWATSSTRRYYGINTHTYLQTSEYATNANTVLMVRGDDAVTAADGVNMYGPNGFHLEFNEVGAGTQRDYNNFNTGVAGLGSDTSSTAEFADEATVLSLRSRPNQANGSMMVIDEVDQTPFTLAGTASYHTAAKSIFGVTSNTANVSIASGGTRNY